MRIISTVIFLFFSFQAFCQDKVVVYFEVGSSKIDKRQQAMLDSIPEKYNLPDLDSVIFIGYADSTGNFRANLKLSEKRANNVAKHCRNFLPKKIPFAIRASGEKDKQIEFQDRRVEINMYFRSLPAELPDSSLDTIIPEEQCYYVDYYTIRRCTKRMIIKNKKEFMLLELEVPLEKKEILYWGTESEKGSVIPKKVRWVTQTTGRLWWKRSRYQTLIPAEDYKKYKVFKIKDLPCRRCHEDFGKKPGIVEETTCLNIDWPLTRNMQVKRLLFNLRKVRVRVPKIYVDTNLIYFMNYNVKEEIEWKEGRRRRDTSYYFCKISIAHREAMHYYYNNISRFMDCCDKGDVFGRFRGDDVINNFWIPWGFEVGDNYREKTHTPYFGVGLYLEGKFSQYNLRAGLEKYPDVKASFYTAARYQYNYFSFPLSLLNPVAEWESPGYSFTGLFGRLYAGTELKYGKNMSREIVLEQTAHAGFSIQYSDFSRAFVQYGLGYDYLRNNSLNVYPIIQFGLIVQLNSRW
jgi:hypothetical protein